MSEIFLPNIIKICLSFFKLRSIMSGMFFQVFCLFQHISCLVCFP